jgi:hypothetical protein
MDIKKIKEQEIKEISDFLEGLEEYGHVYHYPPEKLDEPFKKILEGIQEIHELMDDSYEM